MRKIEIDTQTVLLSIVESTGFTLVTIIATLRWASCGPGTGLQAHPLKSQYIFASSQEISIYDRILPWITRKLRIW